MEPILACSLVAATLIIERLWALCQVHNIAVQTTGDSGSLAGIWGGQFVDTRHLTTEFAAGGRGGGSGLVACVIEICCGNGSKTPNAIIWRTNWNGFLIS